MGEVRYCSSRAFLSSHLYFSGASVIVLRRLILFYAFMVWLGGFVFYTAVVVPVGTEVLGSALDQGLVTQRVTHWLNRLGLIWTILMVVDLRMSRDTVRFRRKARWLGWGLVTGLNLALVALHEQMDDLIDAEAFQVFNRPKFYQLHQVYLIFCTLQWFTASLLAGLTLAAWRAEDASGRTITVTLPGEPS